MELRGLVGAEPERLGEGGLEPPRTKNCPSISKGSAALGRGILEKLRQSIWIN